MTRPKAKQGFWWLKVPFAQMRSDLSSMTKTERADYQDILWLACDVGPLPADLKKLARLVQSTPGQLADLMEIAGHHFADNGDGTLSHIYVEESRIERQRIGKVYAKNRRPRGESQADDRDTIVTHEGHNSDPKVATKVENMVETATVTPNGRKN